jgi:GntR family transcriptional regulator
MLIALDPKDPRPLYLQIIAQIKQQIQTGELRPGEELPSVRELAESLGINLHTVHHAYKELREQGVIYLRLGQRAKVAKLRQNPAPPAEVESVLAGRLRELLTEAFHLGLSPEAFRRLVEEIIAAEKGKR